MSQFPIQHPEPCVCGHGKVFHHYLKGNTSCWATSKSHDDLADKYQDECDCKEFKQVLPADRFKG